MEQVLARLQARRIDRIAAAYAVGGWLLVQAASIAMPSFDAPPWAMRALIIFVLVGFPLTLVLAWFAVPQLAFVDHPVHRRRKHVHLAALAVCGGAAVLAVAGLALQLSHISMAAKSAGDAQPAAPASVAVLPFLNMSGDPSKAYFSDGVSEEILNDLANVPALRVAARTSSFALRGRGLDIKTIGRLLDVGAVLEGSVRESGTRLRITAQLINAGTGYHLWSAAYDRRLTDILDVQDEIARAITSAMTHKLLPAAKPVSGRPAKIDAVAYHDYLKGQQALRPRTQDGAEDALVLFEGVTARAPDFAEGYAALARAMIVLADFHPERKDLLPAADAALSRALVLDPRCVSALTSRLDLALQRLDWEGASQVARRLDAINPNSAAVLHEMFRYYQFLGFPQLALAAAKSAASLDPLSFVDRLNLGVGYLYLARYSEAAAAAHAALALAPGQPDGLGLLCQADARLGQLAEARAIEAQLAPQHSYAQGCAFDIALAGHETHKADAILEDFATNFREGELGATEIATMYAANGENEKAIGWFGRAYALGEPGLFVIPGDRTIPSSLFLEAGWKEIFDRPRFRAWRSAHGSVANQLATRGV